MVMRLRSDVSSEIENNTPPPAAFSAIFREASAGELRQELLAVGDYYIGGEMPADIALPDIDVPELCIIHLTDDNDIHVASVTPLAKGLLGRGRALPVGVRSVMGDHVLLRYGTFEIEIEAIKVGVLGSAKAARPLVFFAASFLLVAAGGIVSQDRWSGIVGRKAPVVAAPQRPMDPTMVLRSAEAELRRRLRNVELHHTLTVSSDGLRLLVSGRVNDEERFRLVETLNSARTALRVPIDTDIVSNVDVSGLIAGVVFEPQTYLISKEGVRLRIGEALSDGSRIDTIEPAGVVIERDTIKERISLTR
jgi:hypothetical protein